MAASETASVLVEVYGAGSTSSAACSSVWARISRLGVSTSTVTWRTHLVALVDRRLVVDQVGLDGLAGDRGEDAVGHHVGVVAGGLDGRAEVGGSVDHVTHAGQSVTRTAPPARRRRSAQSGIVSASDAIRRANQSERASTAGSTRADAVSTVTPTIPTMTRERSRSRTCGEVVLELRHA